MSRLIDDMLVVRELGQGAHTRVCLVRHAYNGEVFCRKSITADAPNWESQLRQLNNEYSVGRHNDHPSLRQSLEFRQVRRRLRAVEAHLLLRYVAGVPLQQWSAATKTSRVLRAFWRVADGLFQLHRRGFVHADLKPHNILVSEGRRPVLIDFGQSCPMRHSKERIQGTADYIAPEQVAREPLDARTDVFGLGATMHLIFFGRPAKTELNASSVRGGGRITIERPRLEGPEESREAPPALLRLIEDCLQPDRDDRPESMERVKDRLELCLRQIARPAPRAN